MTHIGGKEVFSQERIVGKFKEQLQFIQRSCAAFDQGAENEAIRIATALRIIFHDTQSSVSLISHLSLHDRTMYSSARGHGNWQDYLGHKVNLSSHQPITMLPLLGDKFIKRSVDDWWKNETVFIHDNVKYSRRLIVLCAANKDGGAHIDDKLDAFYETLCAGKYALGLTGNLGYGSSPPPFEQGVTQYPKNAHLALIRQFAHETLVSTDHFNLN